MDNRAQYGEAGSAKAGTESRPAARASRSISDRLYRAYERTGAGTERLCGRLVDFGRANPGLVGLGAGISLGLWLANAGRASRYGERVVPALATHAARAVLDILDGYR
jgi:hypothetical protein